jgi:hypothetical protein
MPLNPVRTTPDLLWPMGLCRNEIAGGPGGLIRWLGFSTAQGSGVPHSVELILSVFVTQPSRFSLDFLRRLMLTSDCVDDSSSCFSCEEIFLWAACKSLSRPSFWSRAALSSSTLSFNRIFMMLVSFLAFSTSLLSRWLSRRLTQSSFCSTVHHVANCRLSVYCSNIALISTSESAWRREKTHRVE